MEELSCIYFGLEPDLNSGMADASEDGSGHRARLRQRLFEGGPDALLDHELVEYLLALRAYVTADDTRRIDPDAARPYAVDFDMTAEMIGVMKERYRVAFGLPGETRGRRRRSCPAA